MGPVLAVAASLLLSADTLCVTSQDLRVPTPEGHVLAAILEMPRSARRAVPAVLLISGAGEWDIGYTFGDFRGKYPFYRLLSEQLVRAGFAVVRYHKRGLGASTGNYRETATTARLADDARAIIGAMRKTHVIDGRRISVLGHSEGGSIAGLLGASDHELAGVILMAAPAWDGARIMVHQHRHMLAQPHDLSVDRRISFLLREDAERYENEGWYRFFLTYDPLPSYARIRSPVLIVHGADDWKVTVGQADEIASAIRRGGSKARVDVHKLEGVDHVFGSPGATGGEAAFNQRTRSILVEWLRSVTPTSVAAGCAR